MKTMIISDIKGKSASIIPYGLNLARFLQSETEVIHVIDPRVCQGVATPYADSQTVAPGEKLSHDEIIGKEKGEVSAFLNQIVGREVSRLNYPLQVKVTTNSTVRKFRCKSGLWSNWDCEIANRCTFTTLHTDMDKYFKFKKINR